MKKQCDRGISTTEFEYQLDYLSKHIKEISDLCKLVKDKDVVLLIGRTGTGKSTWGNFLSGADFYPIDPDIRTNEKILFSSLKPISSHVRAAALNPMKAPFATKDGASCTELPQITPYGNTDTYLMDVAGWSDDGTGNKDLLLSLISYLVISHVRSIVAVLFCWDCQDLATSNDSQKEIEDLLCLHDFFLGDETALKNKLIFCPHGINHASGNRQISRKKFLKSIASGVSLSNPRTQLEQALEENKNEDTTTKQRIQAKIKKIDLMQEVINSNTKTLIPDFFIRKNRTRGQAKNYIHQAEKYFFAHNGIFLSTKATQAIDIQVRRGQAFLKKDRSTEMAQSFSVLLEFAQNALRDPSVCFDTCHLVEYVKTLPENDALAELVEYALRPRSVKTTTAHIHSEDDGWSEITKGETKKSFINDLLVFYQSSPTLLDHLWKAEVRGYIVHEWPYTTNKTSELVTLVTEPQFSLWQNIQFYWNKLYHYVRSWITEDETNEREPNFLDLSRSEKSEKIIHNVLQLKYAHTKSDRKQFSDELKKQIDQCQILKSTLLSDYLHSQYPDKMFTPIIRKDKEKSLSTSISLYLKPASASE